MKGLLLINIQALNFFFDYALSFVQEKKNEKNLDPSALMQATHCSGMGEHISILMEFKSRQGKRGNG